jgi:hypothetical protein
MEAITVRLKLPLVSHATNGAAVNKDDTVLYGCDAPYQLIALTDRRFVLVPGEVVLHRAVPAAVLLLGRPRAPDACQEIMRVMARPRQ